MLIKAEAHLYYNEGQAMSSGWEKLTLIVKFKKKGKLFKIRLEETLVSTFNVANSHLCAPEDRLETYDEYYELVNIIASDQEHLKDVATEMIKDYFERKTNLDNKNTSRKELADKINNMPKIQVEVDIK